MLLRCSPLILLSMLQLVVLSKIVAAYIYTSSYTPSATRQTASQFTTSAPGHERTSSLDVKLGGLLKPISISYLKANLGNVSSRFDFVRLFAKADTSDQDIEDLISSRYLHMNQKASHNGDDRVDFSGVGENSGGTDKALNTAENSRSDDASNAADHDYVDEYPQDEPSVDDYEAFEAALYHIEEMKTCSKSKCHDPTPFVLNVRDKYDFSQVFLPECVVLHRCMNYSGCCGDGDQECVPKSMDIVFKSFLVVNLLSPQDDEVTFDGHMATTLSFVNHTECECREKPKLPKCTIQCPTHFRLSQEGAHCICDCFPLEGHDPWHCKSVKDGLHKLPAADLECIHKGECYKPTCTEGEFDDASGYCPLSTEYAMPAFMFEKPTDRYHYREHLRNFDFTSPHGGRVSVAKDALISPTPSSKNDSLFPNINKLGDIEQLLSLGHQVKSVALFPSVESQYSSNTHNSSVQPTQNLSDISESSVISCTNRNSCFSAATNGQPSQTEADAPLQTSANELQINPSYDDEDTDATDAGNYTDYFMNFDLMY